ncbi:MAG TPA: VWA domain-containing protein [Chloroflexota bacterium]|nr:VWA domain-containing protein [Chloroflexota bacterium]
MGLNGAYRYSEWDNSQQLNPFDAHDLMQALAEDLLADGDLQRVLQRLYRMGDEGRLGDRLDGMKQLLERLRDRRQDMLNRHNLNSIMDDLKAKLQDVVDTERHGIDRRVEEAKQPSPADEQTPATDAEALRKMLEQMAAKKKEALDALPETVPQRFQALSQYDFMDSEARDKFQQLKDMLQQQVMQSYFQGMQEAINSISPEDLARTREMVRDLNQMLEDRIQGKEPRFEEFMQKYGDMFPGVNTLDELLEQMQRRMAAMQAMMESMSPEMREQLQQMMDGLIGDDRLRADLARLAMNMHQLFPNSQGRQRYPFRGDEPMSLLEAMAMMENLQSMDELEAQMRAAQHGEGLDQIDLDKVRDALGPEEASRLEQLQQLTKMLEDAGYVRKNGDAYELTPQGIRKIGQKALRDVFGQLKKDSFGKHATIFRGGGGERIDDTKRYTFGDPFLMDIQKTTMNAIQRQGRGTPVRLRPEDFEVYRTELLTQSATVLMLDMSRSMFLNGCFGSAKKVAIALHSLIQSQYPRDVLHIIGFSYLAREIKPEQLPGINWDEYNYGTNLQHALMLGRQLLARSKARNKQMIVITDGEPTTHLEGGSPVFNYPPTYRTIQETLREVIRCTRDQVIINTFMLESGYYLTDFVGQMTKINKGRAFFATPDNLGEYILVDYVANKQKKVS